MGRRPPAVLARCCLTGRRRPGVPYPDSTGHDIASPGHIHTCEGTMGRLSGLGSSKEKQMDWEKGNRSLLCRMKGVQGLWLSGQLRTHEPQQLQDSNQVLEPWGLPPKGACFIRGPCPDGFPALMTVLGTVYWNPEMAVAKYRADFMVRLNQGFGGRGPRGPTRQPVKVLAV